MSDTGPIEVTRARFRRHAYDETVPMLSITSKSPYALKALTEGRLGFYMSIGKDSTGKAHAFRFSSGPRMNPPEVLEPGDESILLPLMA